jgi:hypothetical protein
VFLGRIKAPTLPDRNFPLWIVAIMQTAPKKNLMILGFDADWQIE